jgi:RIO-like serine/threonine protein kinase
MILNSRTSLVKILSTPQRKVEVGERVLFFSLFFFFLKKNLLKNGLQILIFTVGHYIYHEKSMMVQKKISGITLADFMKRHRKNTDMRQNYDCSNIYKHILAQQDEIGYNHGDIRVQNILVHPETGEFKTLIDWDIASKRIPENDSEYSFDFKVGIFIGQCKRRGFKFSNPPQDDTEKSRK